VHRDFLREKHWFQPILADAGGDDHRHSLIVVVVRDPVEWMAAMWQSPYHSPAHVAGFDSTHDDRVMPLPWPEFVRRPWTTTAQSAADARILRQPDPATRRNQTLCQRQFSMQQVVPCQSDPAEWTELWKIPQRRWRGYEPVYELRGNNGTPYDHLLQLRSDKIVNWILQLSLLVRIGGLLVVRYEDLVQNGTESMLLQIASMLASDGSDEKAEGGRQQLPAGCQPTPPQPERLGRRPIPDDFRDWINQHVNVETERLIGYRR